MMWLLVGGSGVNYKNRKSEMEGKEREKGEKKKGKKKKRRELSMSQHLKTLS
jgi:hypothetical protein